MTDKEKEEGDSSPSDIFEILSLQSAKIGELLDYNQTIIKVCRIQAENWRSLSRAFMECASMASEIADQSALIARVSIDRSGDIIATEWGLEEIDGDDDDGDDDLGGEDD